MAAAVKKAVAEIDPDQSVTEVMSMERLLERSTGIYQFYMRILGNSETDGTFLILFEKTRFVRNERRFSESGETSRLSPVSKFSLFCSPTKSLFEFLRLPYALGPIEPRTKHTRMKVRPLKPIEDLRIPSVE